MIFGYAQGGEYKQVIDLTADYMWLDLISPTIEEENLVEALFGVEIPTKEEMAEIELSNRLYSENGAFYITAVIVINAETPDPKTEAVTFIITGTTIITLRYSQMGAFKQYIERISKHAPQNNIQVFSGLVESTINRIADITEKIGVSIDVSSRRVFRDKTSKNRYEQALNEVGTSGDLISKVRESLTSFARALSFANHVGIPADHAQFNIMQHDISALAMHADFLSNKAMFLLDATLGMINFEQNNIIKIFTLAALIFLPPTLVAGVYGMNFRFMPELNWQFGYPMALGVMAISAYLPFRYFKKKGWL